MFFDKKNIYRRKSCKDIWGLTPTIYIHQISKVPRNTGQSIFTDTLTCSWSVTSSIRINHYIFHACTYTFCTFQLIIKEELSEKNHASVGSLRAKDLAVRSRSLGQMPRKQNNALVTITTFVKCVPSILTDEG